MFSRFYLVSTCFFNFYFKKSISFLLSLAILIFIHSVSYAQIQEGKTGAAKASFASKVSSIQGYPAGSLVLMAGGNEKKVEDIQIGELVASYDPVLEDYTVTRVTHLQTVIADEPMASVMLILDDLSASLQTNGNLAGVTMLATTTAEVLTQKGATPIQYLTDNDILYCYDAAAHRFLIFRVYDMKVMPKAAPQTLYKLHTEEKNCIINSTVLLSQSEDL